MSLDSGPSFKEIDAGFIKKQCSQTQSAPLGSGHCTLDMKKVVTLFASDNLKIIIDLITNHTKGLREGKA